MSTLLKHNQCDCLHKEHKCRTTTVMALQDRVAAQPFIKPSFPHARVTATVALLSEANVPMSSHFRIGTSVFPPPGMLFDITPLIIQDSTLNASERMLGLLVWLCVYYGTLHGNILCHFLQLHGSLRLSQRKVFTKRSGAAFCKRSICNR